MKKILVCLFTTLLLSTGCGCKKDKTDCQDEIETCDNCVNDLENVEFIPQCFGTVGGKDSILPLEDSYVINDDSSYQLLKTILISNQTCDSIIMPYIDFSIRTLLGLFTDGGGCKICFNKKVLKDMTNKIYTYNIKIIELGRCDKRRTSMNWITIPKIPQGYSVQFNVTYN